MKSVIAKGISLYFRHASTPVLFFASFLLALFVVTFYFSIYHDSSWLFHVAETLLSPGSNFREIIKQTIPVSILIHFPPVYISEIFAVHAVFAFKIFIFSLLSFFTFVYYQQLNSFVKNWRLSVFFLTALLPLIFMPNMEFGQREHLILCFLLSYTLSVIGRRLGYKLPLGLAVISGFSAALAIGMKPHYVLVMIAFELYLLLWHRSFRGFFRPETMSFALASIAHLCIVLLYMPEVVTEFIPVASNIYWIYYLPLGERILVPHLLFLVFVVATLLFMKLPEKARYVQHILAIGVFTSYLVFVYLGNIWFYRQYPFLGFSYVYLAAFLFYCGFRNKGGCHVFLSGEGRDGSTGNRGVIVLNMALAFLVAKLFIFDIGFYRDFPKLVTGERIERSITNYNSFVERGVLDELPGVKSIFVMDSRIGPHAQIMLEKNLVWGHRYHSMWMLVAWARLHANDKTAPEEVSLDIVDGAIARLHSDLEEDLRSARPDAFIFDISAEKERFNKVAFNYIDHLKRFVPYFNEIWGEYRLYKTFFLDRERKIEMAIYVRKDLAGKYRASPESSR